MLLLLPGLTAGLVFGLPQQELAAPVQVGVVLPQDQGQAFWSMLSSRSDAVVNFTLCDEDTLRAKVSTGQWDCGMVLDEDFDARLGQLRTDGILTFYTGPGSTVYPMVQETAAAVIMQLISGDMALNYMAKNGIEPVFQLEELAPEERVLVSLQTRTGEDVLTYTLARRQLGNLVLGCLGLVLLIWALFGAMDLGKWARTPAVRRLGMVRDPRLLLLSRGWAMLLISALGAGAAALLVPQRWWALAALGPYLLNIWTLALLLSRVEALCSALPSLMSGITLVSLLTSPILFDLEGLHPALDALMRWLPLTQFLQAAQANPAALHRSLLLTLLLNAAFFITP